MRTTHSFEPIPQVDLDEQNGPNYAELKSAALFQAIEQDDALLADSESLYRMLYRRKNKKEDFIAALAYLKEREVNDSAVNRLASQIEDENATKWCNSEELTLLTEIACRVKIITKRNRIDDTIRCIDLVSQRLIPFANEAVTTFRRAFWVSTALVVTGLLLIALAEASVLAPVGLLFHISVMNFLSNIGFYGGGVAALVGTFVGGPYAVFRDNAAKTLSNVSTSVYGFFSRRVEEAPPAASAQTRIQAALQAAGEGAFRSAAAPAA